LEAKEGVGVEHHVLISIVGIDSVPFSYYRAKLEQERLVADGPVEASVLRSTQFHQLLDRIFSLTSRVGLLPGGAALLQPIDAREVARRLGSMLQEGSPPGRWELAGPEILRLSDLARAWRDATRTTRILVPIRLATTRSRELRAGALTRPDMAGGGMTFSDWVKGAYANGLAR
jgi:uncharacterized protein YbjT (DUF2867 family)